MMDQLFNQCFFDIILINLCNGFKDHQELFTGLLNIEEELVFCSNHNLDVLIEVKRKEELINSVI